MSSSIIKVPQVEVPCPFDESVQRIVRYGCSCGMPQPLCKLYFCRHCMDIRCGFCVSHEVDSHFCPNCFQTMLSAEARIKKHRCPHCFDCPTCGHTLNVRATSVQSQSTEDPTKVVVKKAYYLACGFCRWTTRDLGLPDQAVASGGWPEPENPDLVRFGVLLDHYRALAQKEKMEKETRRFLGSKMSYTHLSDKISAASVRKRAGLPPLGSIRTGLSSGASSLGPISMSHETSNDVMLPSEAVDIDEVEKSPWNEMFESEKNLSQIPKLQQMLWQIDLQDGMHPRRKRLDVKRSQRCRQCEHNLSKPEFNPQSIKFKIQLHAFCHIPEIKILKMPAQDLLKPRNTVNFLIKIVNPTQHATHIEIIDLETAKNQAIDKEGLTSEDGKSGADGDHSENDKVSIRTSLRQPLLVKASPRHELKPNTTFLTPKIQGSLGSKVLLPARDDAAEFDDSAGNAELSGLVDDKEVVAWRKGNKVALSLLAKMPEKFEPEDTEILVGFGVKFVYTNIVPTLEQREVQKVDVTLPVYLILGKAS